MEQDDLTEIKHIALNRLRLFNDLGITTIKQLREMPLEKLAGIKSIGTHYAKLIKNSVAEYDRVKHDKLSDQTAAAKEGKPHKITRDLKKRIKRLHKNLNRVNENLKPLWKKKYLELYIDFKKQFKKLKTRLSALGRIKKDLPKKERENIIKKADALILNLKKVGKNPKKKKYKQTIQEIQSFSRFLRDFIS